MRPQKPQDKSLDELFVLLTSHFEPRIAVIAERFCFYQRLQREGETVANYMTELRRLSKHCDFGDYLDTALMDQLVCGLYHEAVQRKILAESELTFTKELHIAQAAETARDETHALREIPQSNHLQSKSRRRFEYNLTQQLTLTKQSN